MQTVISLWSRIKRNPVIMAALGTIAVQILHDAQDGTLTADMNWIKYLATLGFGLLARQFTTPFKEAEDARMRALSLPRPTPGIKFPEDGEK